MPLKIRYKPFYSLGLAGLGFFNLVMWLLPITRNEISKSQILLAVIMLGFGVSNYLVPLGVIQPDRVVSNRVLGLVKLNRSFRSLNDLKLEHSELYVFTKNRWKTVGIRKFVAHPADWKALERLVTSARNR